jgi:hypothetical protein
MGGNAARDRRKGGHSGTHLDQQLRRFRRTADFEVQGLVIKVQGMQVGADAGEKMHGSLAVTPCRFGIDVGYA